MNSDNAQAKPHVLAALRKADAVIGIGDVHGWDRPQAYVDSLAILNACREAERTIPSLPPPVGKPKDVAKWIDGAVDVRAREATRRDVIDELVLTWERNTANAGLAATTEYCARLVTVFDELVEKFDAHAGAPRELNGRETDEQIAAHTAALRLASDLSNALMQRRSIAEAAQEAEDVGPDPIWFCLAPHADTTRDGVENALSNFNQRTPQCLADWDELRGLGLRLAQVGEVAARRERYAAFLYAVGMSTLDLGQLDHSFGEIENNPPASRNGRIMAAQADDMFDRATPFGLA